MNELLQKFIALAQEAANSGVRINALQFTFINASSIGSDALYVTKVHADMDSAAKGTK